MTKFDDLKSTDFGAMAGPGIDIATSGSISVPLDVLYNLGPSSNPESGDVKNRAFSIMAGIGGPLG